MSSHSQSRSKEDRRLKHLIEVLRGTEHLGLPALICLLTIGLEDGLSVTELAERTGAPQQSVSRYVAMLLGRYQSEALTTFEPLIDQRISLNDPRKRALHLTREGRHLVEELLSLTRADKRAEAHVSG